MHTHIKQCTHTYMHTYIPIRMYTNITNIPGSHARPTKNSPFLLFERKFFPNPLPPLSPAPLAEMRIIMSVYI